MRKGAKRNDWTVSEVRYLIANAGKMPRRDICQLLKRSSASVKMKAHALRQSGIDISLRYYTPTLEACPHCGHLSATIDHSGRCEPCRRADQLSEIHARIADVLAKLPPSERDTYEHMESIVTSEVIPLPEAPNTRGMSAYKKARAEEAYAIATEQCVAQNLRRQIKAAQKRKERMEKKLINETLQGQSKKGA